MAHKSLMLKLKARNNQKKSLSKTLTDSNAKLTKNSESADNLLHIMQQMETECKNETHHPNFVNAEMKMVDFQNDQIKEQDVNFKYKKRRVFYLEDQHGSLNDDSEKVDHEEEHQEQMLPQSTVSTASSTARTSRSSSFRNNETDNRVDKIYTVGCFDLFHHGHVQLIKRMRELGKKVIVGVHDSRSIYKLKNRVPVDSTEKRMLNVKTMADEVFCIAGCDPSSFMTCIVNLGKNETALYVRGDDMPNFPCREVVENLMPIRFLPYTQGVSSTQIRKEMFSHIAPDDENYLNTNS
jgi:cytidyltransferase-like protein